VSAAEAAMPPRVVRFSAEIEPLVRLLEEAPRERLLEEIASRIHLGLSYREVLTALLLAGAEYPAAARRVQIPFSPGRQLGPPREPIVA